MEIDEQSAPIEPCSHWLTPMQEAELDDRIDQRPIYLCYFDLVRSVTYKEGKCVTGPEYPEVVPLKKTESFAQIINPETISVYSFFNSYTTLDSGASVTSVSTALADTLGLRAIVDWPDCLIVQMADGRQAKTINKTIPLKVCVSISKDGLP